jgi:hypothetical protein
MRGVNPHSYIASTISRCVLVWERSPNNLANMSVRGVIDSHTGNRELLAAAVRVAVAYTSANVVKGFSCLVVSWAWIQS